MSASQGDGSEPLIKKDDKAQKFDITSSKSEVSQAKDIQIDIDVSSEPVLKDSLKPPKVTKESKIAEIKQQELKK